jgi:tryptophan halogenase
MTDRPHKPDAIRKVVIVGGGTAGWMAATLFSKLYERAFEIVLIESDEIGIIGVGEATIPPIKRYNSMVELDEYDCLKAAKGTYKLGIEFVDWLHPGHSYMHSFGKIGQDLGWLRTHQYWLKTLQEGRAAPFDHFAINAVASRRNKFMRARADMTESPLGEIAHAYHFDAALYARYLRGLSEGRGVRRIEGKIVDVRLRGEDGFVEAVVMESGEAIAGDLFLDCSGIRGLLIEQALHAGYEAWSEWLPCDRAIAVPCASVEPLTPYTRSTAQAGGWRWRIPLQHRIGNGVVYSSQHLGEDEATAGLLANLDGEALAEPRVIKFTPGVRKEIWKKNVVAVGLSSGFLEPLESTSIHLIQSGLIRLVTLFPDRSFNKAVIDEYNRQTYFEYSRVRDFIIAHYKLNAREEPMWRACREMAIPDTLREKLDLFGATGQVFRFNEELFAEESWIQVLLGQGLIPQIYDPGVDVKTPEEIDRYLQNIENVIDKCVDVMPPHIDFVNHFCKA